MMAAAKIESTATALPKAAYVILCDMDNLSKQNGTRQNNLLPWMAIP